jgi:hypothetical protein
MTMLGRPRADEWERLWQSFVVLEETMMRDRDGIAVNAIFRTVRGHLERLFRVADGGGPVVWYNLGFNPDLLFGFDDVLLGRQGGRGGHAPRALPGAPLRGRHQHAV